MLNPETNSLEACGISPRFVSKLSKLGIETARDLLHHFPSRYEDFSKVSTVDELHPGETTTIHGIVSSIKTRRTWHRRMSLIEAIVTDATGEVRATWFNQPYLVKTLTPGTPVRLAGRVVQSKKNGDFYFLNPTHEIKRGEDAGTHTGRIIPIYPETRGLTSKGVRFLITKVLSRNPEFSDPLPHSLLTSQKLLGLKEAIRAIHFPEHAGDVQNARTRFAFEDLLLLQLRNIRERERVAKLSAFLIPNNIENIKNLISELPFSLTQDQKKSLWDVTKDLNKPQPMNRLLQGDVGSGKTAVAVLAALHVAHAGVQTAFMAPTEILARQHYRTIEKLFPNFEGGVALMTASGNRVRYGAGMETEISRTDLERELAYGRVSIAIGTHALLPRATSPGSFKKLGLVIIDEQHRFGVRQRAALLKAQGIVPHLLSMSATPIPRTLALTIFGDLDVSIISELPKNRAGITTHAVPPEKRTAAYAFINEQIKSGRQAFVICPRIEPKESEPTSMDSLKILEAKTVKEEYERLSKKIFPNLRIGMLHGKMPAREKEQIMERFTSRKIDLLVSTSVVEVGVDVPNASVIVVEGSERFGLAQLYQFRGRVGRGEHASYCLLFTESNSPETARRLRAIVSAKNGFELAEEDLKIRGPGEFFGDSQTGIPDIAMEAIRNPKLVQSAREAAGEIIEKDPLLSGYPLLRERLEKFSKEIHRE